MVTAIATPSVHHIGLKGVVSVGDGRSSFGDVNAYDVNGTLVLPWKDLIQNAFKLGRSVYVLEGQYEASSGGAVIGLTGGVLDISRQAIITLSGSTAPMMLDVSADNFVVRGGTVVVPTFVASADVIRMTGQNVWCEGITFNCTDATATGFTGSVGTDIGHEVAFLMAGNTNSGLAAHNPMRLIALKNATAKRVTGCTFYPNKGVVCLYSESSGVTSSGGNLIALGNVFRSLSDNYTPVHNLCYRAIDINGDEYATINANTFFQIGTNAAPCDAVIFVRGHTNSLIESGHMAISGNMIERCPSPCGIKVWGAPSVNINGNMYGLNGQVGSALSGADAIDEAGIFLTGLNGKTTGNPILTAVITGNDLHNLAATVTDAAFVLVTACDSLAFTGNSLSVCLCNAALQLAALTVGRAHISGNSFRGAGAAQAIWLRGANNIPDGLYIGGNSFEGFVAGNPLIKDDSNASAATRRKILTGIQDTTTGADAVFSLAGITAADILATTNVRLDAP